MDDALLDSVTDIEFTKYALATDAEIINKVKQLKFQIAGTTDNRECSLEACNDLSLRRAQLVHDWLVSHGVAESRLKPPIGRGDQAPITDNATEDARSFNRRAVVDFLLD